jgi:predicted TIM-barrel fold metal-dependent hydrolase
MDDSSTRRGFGLSLLALAASSPLEACVSAAKGAQVSAIDCHAHVFRRDLPMPDRRRAPSGYGATPENFLHKLEANGMTHGVLVQPSFLGADNRYLVAALNAHPRRLRGVAVVEPGVSDSELSRLDDAGVVGIRLNQIGLPTPDFAAPRWQALLAQLHARRWHVQVHQTAGALRDLIDPLLAADLDVVIDHFGRPDPGLGIADPGFAYMLSLAPSRRVWVKLSGAYRNGANGVGEATAMAAMPLLKASFGLDRLVWGSDWPHTLFEASATYETQRALLDRWLPEAAERAIVLGETPARRYRFDA